MISAIWMNTLHLTAIVGKMKGKSREIVRLQVFHFLSVIVYLARLTSSAVQEFNQRGMEVNIPGNAISHPGVK
jgi:hypothetical protein